MAEERSQYSSTILVSKSPIEAADIFEHRLGHARKINTEFINWFHDYATFTSEYNSKLNVLLKRGADINQRVSSTKIQDPQAGELGNLLPLWNSILSTLHTEITGNDIFVSNIKKDSINQMKNFFTRDVRWVEALDFQRELSDIASKLNKEQRDPMAVQNLEFRWNSKAPQYFDAFETVDFVRINLIKDVFLKFQSHLNDKTTQLLRTTEKSTASILEFNPQDEIVRFSEYVSSIPTSESIHESSVQNAIPSMPEAPFMGRGRGTSHSTVQSYNSFDSDVDDSKKKTRNKLKSKVGSIFGMRKGKTKLGSTPVAIPEGSQSPPSDYAESFSRVSGSSNVERSYNNQQATGAYNGANNGRANGNSFSQTTAQSKGLPPSPSNPVSNYSYPLQPTRKLTSNSGVEQESNSPNLQTLGGSSDEEQDIMRPHGAFAPEKFSQQSPLSRAPLNAYQEQPKEQITPPTTFPESNGQQSPTIKLVKDPSTGSIQLPSQPVGLGIENDFNKRESAYPDPDISGLSPQVGRSSYAESISSSEHKKPAPPPSRKSTMLDHQRGNGDSLQNGYRSGVVSSSPTIEESTSFEKPLPGVTSASSVGGVRGNRRKDIQSQLFTNLPQARESVFINKLPAISGSDQTQTQTQTQNTHLNHQQVPSYVQDSVSNPNYAFQSTGNNEKPGSQVDDLAVAPPAIPSGESRSLSSQNTGSSLSNNVNSTFKHAELNEVGLSASISEIVNAIFKNGDLVKSQTVGEIAFNYKDQTLPQQLKLKISNSGNISKVLVNNQFMKQISEDEYLIDPQLIFLRSLGGLKYILNKPVIPIIIQQVWRYEPHQASLMISLKLSPELLASKVAITLSNVVISVAIEGAETTSASSRPQGSFNKEKSRISWRYPSVINLSPAQQEERLIARFMTNGTAKENEAGVSIRFLIDTSNIDLENELKLISFDESHPEGFNIPVSRNLISGSYSGHY